MIIKGVVIKGKQRGKELGFPTANVSLRTGLPAGRQGIYISQTSIENALFPSLTFIGNAKTFGEKDVFAETYIFNFNKDIYGTEITVTLLKKIRENKKFDSVEELIKQMNKDKQEAEEYFKT